MAPVALTVGASNGGFTVASFSTSWLPWTQLSAASFEDALSSCSSRSWVCLPIVPQTSWGSPLAPTPASPPGPPSAVSHQSSPLSPHLPKRNPCSRLELLPQGSSRPSSSHQQQVGQLQGYYSARASGFLLCPPSRPLSDSRSPPGPQCRGRTGTDGRPPCDLAA